MFRRRLLSAQLVALVAVALAGLGYADDWYSDHPLFGVKAAVRVMNERQLAAVTTYVNGARPAFDRDLSRLHAAKQALLLALLAGAETAPSEEAYLDALRDLTRRRIALSRQTFALLTPQQKVQIQRERANNKAWARLWTDGAEP
jgi:hypothetical protein